MPCGAADLDDVPVIGEGGIMSFRIIPDDVKVPDGWHGKHYLNCLHQLNRRSEINYQMFCNILKRMSDGRLKIEVFGYRYFFREEFLNRRRVRYVDADRVVCRRW